MDRDALRSIQTGLANSGFNPGPIDGLWGSKTKAALEALLVDKAAKPAITAPKAAPVSAGNFPDIPWITEVRTVFGLHETRDNAKLRAWLKSDGKTLGDPKALPWCGDFVETAIKRALPDEPFIGSVAVNPYWARNWVTFGKRTDPVYGAIMVFERGAAAGHIGFAVGIDDDCFYVLGGNQGDTVSIVRIEKHRLLSARWATTFANPNFPLPKLNAGKIPKSTNEF